MAHNRSCPGDTFSDEEASQILLRRLEEEERLAREALLESQHEVEIQERMEEILIDPED